MNQVADEFADFATREVCNEGARLPLPKADGAPSDHWLLVLGPDSDQHRVAQTRLQREAFTLSLIKDNDEQDAKTNEAQRELIASLVIGWSFSAPFSRDAVKELLKRSPYIEDLINDRVSSRRGFFALRSNDSASSPGTPSIASTGSTAEATSPALST